jgi:hypothetical protein
MEQNNPMTNLKNYYRLCKIQPDYLRANPLMNQINEKAVTGLFTAKTVDLFLTKKDDVLMIKETVVGGGNDRKKKQLIMIL